MATFSFLNIIPHYEEPRVLGEMLDFRLEAWKL
jgi:hypothetical protein